MSASVECLGLVFVGVQIAGTGHVRQDDRDIRSLRQKLFDKDAGFAGAVGSLEIHIGVGVNEDCHSVSVGGEKDPLHLHEV